MGEGFRKSGIEIISDLPWGTHFCQFYETKEDLLDLLVPYFKAGLETNEFCLWITGGPITVEDAWEALKKTVHEFDQHIKRNSIEILPSTEWYLKNGKFDSKAITVACFDKLESALKRGYEGMRINGNGQGLKQINWYDLMKFENGLNDAIHDKPMIVLCTYPLSGVEGSALLQVAHAHGCVVSKRQGEWEILEGPKIKIGTQSRQANEKLEQQVTVRTSELSELISQLKKEIAERRKVEALINSEKKLSNEIINSIPGLFALFDANLKFVRWNKSFEMVSGYTPEEILTLHGIESFFDNEKDKQRVSGILNEIFEKGSGSAEVSPLMKDGKPVHLFFIGRSFQYEGKTYLITTGIDITQRKKAEEDLNRSYERIRSLSEHLRRIREEERKYIARVIHDELGQYLTVLKMDVGTINKRLQNTEDEIIQKKLKGLLELIDNIVQTVRRIASELRPSMLDDLGLAAAIAWQLGEFEKHTGIKTYFDEPKEELNLSEPIKTHLFRIVQESLTNVARHAKATEVKVDIVQENGTLNLTVADNGTGFKEEDMNERKTLGIMGMRERADMIGGKYEIETEPGKGTTISVTLSLNAKPD